MNTLLFSTTTALIDLPDSACGDSEVLQVRRPVATRFGPLIDVRNRGSLRLGRCSARSQAVSEQPAVVRIWNGEQCRELNVHDARALAAQLNEAAAFADFQNNR